jgi:hypothetical protein
MIYCELIEVRIDSKEGRGFEPQGAQMSHRWTHRMIETLKY